MEEDKNPKSRSRLKTAGIVLACGLAGITAVVLGLMLADVLIVYAMEGSGEQPMLYVMERAEPGESMVVPLTEQDFADHPALDAVIRGEERNPSAWEWGSRDQRVVGGTRVSYAESRALHDAYGPQGGEGTVPAHGVRGCVLRGPDDMAVKGIIPATGYLPSERGSTASGTPRAALRGADSRPGVVFSRFDSIRQA